MKIFLFHSTKKISTIKSFQWAPEVVHYSPKTPFILVGTQIDLRDDPDTLRKLEKTNQKALTTKQGEKLAQEIKAVKYLECSAKTQVINFSFHFFNNKNFLFSARIKKCI